MTDKLQQELEARGADSIRPLLRLAKDRYNIMLCSGVSGLDTATAWRLAIEEAERFVNKTQQKADESASQNGSSRWIPATTGNECG